MFEQMDRLFRSWDSAVAQPDRRDRTGSEHLVTRYIKGTAAIRRSSDPIERVI